MPTIRRNKPCERKTRNPLIPQTSERNSKPEESNERKLPRTSHHPWTRRSERKLPTERNILLRNRLARSATTTPRHTCTTVEVQRVVTTSAADAITVVAVVAIVGVVEAATVVEVVTRKLCRELRQSGPPISRIGFD